MVEAWLDGAPFWEGREVVWTRCKGTDSEPASLCVNARIHQVAVGRGTADSVPSHTMREVGAPEWVTFHAKKAYSLRFWPVVPLELQVPSLSVQFHSPFLVFPHLGRWHREYTLEVANGE